MILGKSLIPASFTCDHYIHLDLSHLKHWLNVFLEQGLSFPLTSYWVDEYQQARWSEGTHIL